MKLKLLAASAMTIATIMSAAPAAAYAQGDSTFRYDDFFRSADINKDSMVSRKEFLDAMGKMYDKGMAKMKSDPKMVKGNLMTMDGVKALLADIYRGA